MIKKIISLLLISAIALTGCGDQLQNQMVDAMKEGHNIQLSVDAPVEDQSELVPFNWVELGQLKTFKELRDDWDYNLNIFLFDDSKNGVLYVDTDGSWAGNNTLKNAFSNKKFVEDYWNNHNVRDELSKAGVEYFSDIQDDPSGLLAGLNAYFNILQTNKDKTSGLNNYLTRAQAMAAIVRSDTPVVFVEEAADFKNVVGDNENNIFAQDMKDGYLPYENGSLNNATYNGYVTRAEVVYMLMHRYFEDELKNLKVNNNTFGDCKNAGNVAVKKGFIKSADDTSAHAWQSYELEYCLQNPDDGVTEELFKALQLAKSKGIINGAYWNDPVLGGELISMLVQTYLAINNQSHYAINADKGDNQGINYFANEKKIAEAKGDVEEQAPDEYVQIGQVEVTEVKDVTDLDDLRNTYGYELDLTDAEFDEAKLAAMGYTFEPDDRYMQVNYCYWLNVRVGPSVDFRIIKSVASGTKVHIVGRCKENGWYRVIADKKIAYQCGAYFSELDDEVQKSK